MIYGAIWQGCVASCAEARRALKHTHTCGQHTRKSFKLKARIRYPPSLSRSLCVAISLWRSFVIWLHPHKAFILCADACVVPQTGDANKMKLQGGTQTLSLCVCVELQEQMPQPIAADSKSKAMPHLARGASKTSAPPGCQPQ